MGCQIAIVATCLVCWAGEEADLKFELECDLKCSCVNDEKINWIPTFNLQTYTGRKEVCVISNGTAAKLQ